VTNCIDRLFGSYSEGPNMRGVPECHIPGYHATFFILLFYSSSPPSWSSGLVMIRRCVLELWV
jgi:hypothetical protein